jgi:hypothetical protein
MLLPKPTVHFLAEQALEELRADGVVVEDAEVLWLDQLARAITENSDLTTLADWLDFPRPCGSLLFQQPSFAALEWLDRYATSWFEGEGQMEVFCIAYMLVFGRQPKAFANLLTKAAAEETIKAWARTLTISPVALAAGVNEFLKNQERVEVEPDKIGTDHLQHVGFAIPWLTATFGGTREDWLYGKSRREFLEHLNRLPEVMGHGHDDKGNNFEEMRRHREFRAAVEFIKRGRVAA